MDTNKKKEVHSTALRKVCRAWGGAFLALTLVAQCAMPALAVDPLQVGGGYSANGLTEEMEQALVIRLPAMQYLPLSGGDYPTFPAALEQLATKKDLTVMVQFMQKTSALSALFSVSNSTAAATHLNFYANGATLGYEIRGVAGGDVSGSASALRPAGLNTVAFVANSADYTLKLYANGVCIHTKTLDAGSYRMLADMAGLDAITLGKTPRNGNNYPYSGVITALDVYDQALSEADVISFTKATPPAEKETLPEKETQPFYSNDGTGSQYFRIPALMTLKNGNVMAAIDARFGGASDSPNNLDTAVRIFDNAASTWGTAQLPNHFTDFSDGASYQKNSASFIDPQIVQVEGGTYDGRVLMLVDAYPYGTGINSYPEQSINGMMQDTSYLALTTEDRADWANYTYYLKPNPSASTTNDQYLIYSSVDGNATEYTADSHFNLFQAGVALTVKQGDTDETVPMNVFYADAVFQVFPTSYLWLIHSDDNGATWSAPRIIGNDSRSGKNGNFLGVGPGRGHVVKTGAYQGRILFCVYDEGVNDAGTGNRNERASALYSDDGGETWTLGGRTTMAATNSPGKSSEAQIIELPDGTLRMYARGSAGYIGFTDSTDGGATWAPMVQDPGLAYCGNCMISVINYSKTVDGKPALVLASPEGPSRSNGIIRVGLITENAGKTGMEKYTVDWTYKAPVNTGNYSYSCLTELANGDVGLLYEYNTGTIGENPIYRTYTLAQLTTPEAKMLTFEGGAKPGAEVTTTLVLPEPMIDKLSNVAGSALSVRYPNAGLAETTLAYTSISADNRTITYTGTLAETPEGYGYSYEIYIPASFPVVDLLGWVTPARAGSLFGTASGKTAYGITTEKVNHGTLSAPARSAAGATITITATPETGYMLKPDTVQAVSEHMSIPVTKVSDTSFTFTMPAEKVSISAQFVMEILGGGLATPGYARVKLQWNPSEQAGAVYTIWRGATQDSQKEAVAAAVTSTVYNDDTAGTSTQHWYRVDTTVGTTTTSGTPFRAGMATGAAALKANATVYYAFEGTDRVFDGTRVVDKTVDLDLIKELTAGTILAQFRNEAVSAADEITPLFAVGSKSGVLNDAPYYGINKSGGLRYNLTGGLVSNANSGLLASDGQWHTAALVDGSKLVYSALDGSTAGDGRYTDAKWDGFLSRAKDKSVRLGIGGFAGTAPANTGKWKGEIAYVLVTDEVLTQAQAQALTISEQKNFPKLTIKGVPVLAGQTGATAGTLNLEWNAASGAYLRLSAPGEGNNNDFFTLTDGKLTTAKPLTADEAYRVTVEYGHEGGQAFSSTLAVRCRAVEQPFYAGDATGTVQYRIPALLTLQNGDVMASIDARYGPNDSPDNLDTALRIQNAATSEWSPVTLPNHFVDYPDTASGKTTNSASFIDPELVQSNSGRIFLLVDAFPYGAGYPTAQAGTGMVSVAGKQYLALTDGDYSKMSSFKYYIGSDRKVYTIEGSKATAYTVDAEFNLYKDGVALSTTQYTTEKSIPMNIFYAKSDLRVFKTSYLWVRHSDDNGVTWSAPTILNELKRDVERFFGTGPGRGLVIKTGTFAGRIVLSVYDDVDGERASAIYSDDNGLTWKRSTRPDMGTSGLGKTSESQIIELPDGTLRVFCRTAPKPGHIGFADSFDGGATWTAIQKDEALTFCGNCQISAINYSKTIDGKPAILLSYPETLGVAPAIRSDGIIRIGLITAHPEKKGTTDHYTIDWAYRYLYQPGRHDYSCLTELPNGGIAVFHEALMDSAVAGENVVYRTFTLNQLMDKVVNVAGVSLDTHEVSLYHNGAPSSVKLTATVTPAEADNKAVTWVSSDACVVVDADGTVTAKADGTAVITVTTVDGSFTDTCTITVSTYTGGWSDSSGGSTTSPTPSPTPPGTVTNPDGSKTTTVTDATTGMITQTTVQLDGTTVAVETQKDGKVSATITLPKAPTAGTVRVIVPIKGAGPGTAALLVHEDGATTRIGNAVMTEAGLSVPLSGSAKILIVDQSKTFADVPSSAWYADAVAFATGHALFQGTGDETFSPMESMTRAMLATVLYRFADAKATASTAFSDVAPDAWYAEAVSWAAKTGVTAGVGSTFQPDAALTRESLAVMLYRYGQLLGLAENKGSSDLGKFSDANKVSAWAVDAMSWANACGILQGSGTQLNPDGTATRAEVATMLMRFVAYLAR